MDEVPDATVESLTKRMLATNLAAIHVRAYHYLRVHAHSVDCVTDISQRMCDW